MSVMQCNSPSTSPERARSKGVRPLARPVVALAAVALAVAACLGGFAWFTFDTYHYAVVEPGVLYRDGLRSEREFRNALRRSGARTVVSLLDADEAAREPWSAEERWCREAGVELVRIPVTRGARPDADQVAKFFDVVKEKSQGAVLVHCAQGVRRTGMMVAAYDQSVRGLDDRAARDAILAFGKTGNTYRDLVQFIEDYEPGHQIAPRPATVVED